MGKDEASTEDSGEVKSKIFLDYNWLTSFM